MVLYMVNNKFSCTNVGNLFCSIDHTWRYFDKLTYYVMLQIVKAPTIPEFKFFETAMTEIEETEKRSSALKFG